MSDVLALYNLRAKTSPHKREIAALLHSQSKS